MNILSTSLAFVGVALLMGAGCSKDSLNPAEASAVPLAVQPNDGETNVRLDAAILLRFAGPVDRAVVERNVHLMSKAGMADSLCPTSTSMGHSSMQVAMMDSSMMRHLAERHATSGRFSWSGNDTQCSFRPDSMMTPRTQYMIHMAPEMMQMIRSRMGDAGIMAGHGFEMMKDDMMFHFVTMDTLGTGGGHGHH
ncbi:MAG: hypothetical protein AB1428_02575 [Bacteroidota bacterium]